jgi:hypothetical protein
MLTDGLTAQQAEGKAREEVEVLDVAQMLLASVKRGADAKVTAAAAPAADADATDEPMAGEDVPAVEDVPKLEPGDATDPEWESVPEESDYDPEIPGHDGRADTSPAEQLTEAQESEPVDQESRDEEAGTIRPVHDDEDETPKSS